MVSYYAEIKNVKMFQLLKKKWLSLKEMVYVLRILYNTTLAFQNEKLTLSDVYGRWVTTQLHLKQCSGKKSYKTGLANKLYESLEERKDSIFNNPLMFAAIFLDPRFQRTITCSDSKFEKAKSCLTKIARRRFILNTATNNRIPTDAEVSANSLSFEFDPSEAMHRHLANNAVAIHEPTNAIRPNAFEIDIDIEAIIDSFQVEALPVSASVLEYWQSKKEEHPELHALAAVVFSVPPTEVQIERDFSSLNFVFSDRRCSLTAERLEDIMLIHLNRDLFELVNREDIDSIREI